MTETTTSGSFRDPDSRVLGGGDGVYRVLSAAGLEDWRALAGSKLFERLAGSSIVATEEIGAPPELIDRAAGMVRGGPRAVLKHERIPFVSYPYEWTFSMLRDAAELELDLLLAALDEGLTLKDASSYNVQWQGTRPLFIDVGSFERLREGEPWAGYRQFCMLFLYPLMLQAYRGVDFQPLLRGAVNGIAPDQAARLLRGRDLLRRGTLTNVRLHAGLERSFADRSARETSRDLRRARFGTEMIRANAQRLRKLVRRLEWKPGHTAWTDYRDTSTYSDDAAEAKARFVSAAAAARPGALVWDLGCNDGTYSRLAAEHASYVVAIDFDHATADGLYRALREQGDERILPLVVDLADPSPGLGWRGAERPPLPDRGRPQLALALALVHHLSITANVPLADVVSWLRSLGGDLVVEFPKREDPMVERLLSGKPEGLHVDYGVEQFERRLESEFRIERRRELPGGTRVLYEAVAA